jgi:hypothetical protein
MRPHNRHPPEFNLPPGTERQVDGLLNEGPERELRSARLFWELLGRLLFAPCHCRLCVN